MGNSMQISTLLYKAVRRRENPFLIAQLGLCLSVLMEIVQLHVQDNQNTYNLLSLILSVKFWLRDFYYIYSLLLIH